MNKEIINGSIQISNDSFYLVDENLIKAFSPHALVIAMNEMFGAEIDPLHSKISATSRNIVRVGESTEWQEAGFGYKGLFNYFKNILNIPIDTDKSFARTTSCWYIYLQDSYKEAFNKMLDSEGNEVDNNKVQDNNTLDTSVTDNSQAKQENSEKNNEQTNNNEEVNINEEDDRAQEKEDSTGNESDCDEAGMQQDQEGTQDESGASNVTADPSGTNGVQGLNEPVVREKPKPKQTSQRKAKKA